MNWHDIQEVVDYVENNIFDKLNPDEIAKKIYSSKFHFHRAFTIITGISIGEYIRNRKLSLAGQELFITKAKVIDIALKYGYESPESFTKAFSRFHGLNPSEARISNANLVLYNPLKININITGGFDMDNISIIKETIKYTYNEGRFSECTDLNDILYPAWNSAYLQIDHAVLESMFAGTSVAYTNSGRAIGETKSDAGINALSPDLIAIIEKSKKMMAIIRISNDVELNTVDAMVIKVKETLSPDTAMNIAIMFDETLKDEACVTIISVDNTA